MNLGLAVANGADNGGLDHGGADGLLAGVASGVAAARGGAARGGNQLDGLALGSPVAVVEVVEFTRQALVEDGGGAEGNGAVVAGGETSSVDGAGLGRGAIELELVVGDNGADAALLVSQDTVLERQDEAGVRVTAALLFGGC